MNKLSKRQKEQFLVVFSALFLLSIVLFSYFKLYSPAKSENELVQQAVVNERDILFALQRQSAQKQPKDFESSRLLQQQIPVKPLEELVALQIGKAEVKSDLIIQEINFTVDEPIAVDLPEEAKNVKQLIAEVVVRSDDYAKIDRFLEEMESMERIFVVSAIELRLTEEQSSLEKIDKPMDLTISFQAFYRPDLINLEQDSPKVDAPHPAEKIDPTPYNVIKDGDVH
ncbi:hypothetical protein ACFQ38_02500 [Sporosarcina contaminans]|uniref:Pilus assembly protein PilO n=1 Tax=Sporosarcina contaminans TaxID=633403 RepID=A0ABW3TTN0_9BACL